MSAAFCSKRGSSEANIAIQPVVFQARLRPYAVGFMIFAAEGRYDVMISPG
jgi:hypothetical protein